MRIELVEYAADELWLIVNSDLRVDGPRIYDNLTDQQRLLLSWFDPVPVDMHRLPAQDGYRYAECRIFERKN